MRTLFSTHLVSLMAAWMYKVDRNVQARLLPEMFLGLTSLPLNSAFSNMLGAMQTSGDDFKRKLLMDLISNFFAPTTSLRPNSRCFPILDHIGNVANMNWCKFIVGFLHTSLFNKMYNKGCRLHLMLMYVDKLDISTVNLNPVGGLPPSHKFSTSAWSDATTKAVLTADKKLDGTYAYGRTQC
uniref:Uncharacterized protein n=1 Tax=Aegilops tauschii subsp. strangulata TaxID=200361 RepID=A0A453BL12_AEGTS